MAGIALALLAAGIKKIIVAPLLVFPLEPETEVFIQGLFADSLPRNARVLAERFKRAGDAFRVAAKQRNDLLSDLPTYWGAFDFVSVFEYPQ